MSCNGCRVLRRGCTEDCILRPCLDWIQSPQAQANATQFVSKFFGRTDLMSFISAVPENKRPALFQSLLFEACGRTVNPVTGAVGLVSTGKWHICQAAVETVLAGGALRPLSERSPVFVHETWGCMEMNTASFGSGSSEISPESVWDNNNNNNNNNNNSSTSSENGVINHEVGSNEPKLLNLFG